MTQLMYAGVDLSETKTLTYAITPVMDRAGIGFLWNKLEISVVSVVHSLWCATGKKPGGLVAGGNMGVPGDRMGVSLALLPQILGQPRQSLFFRVGEDLVVESPPRLPDGTQLPCDCANGPITSGVRVLEVQGDTSAIVSFTVTTCLNTCSVFCLSNRWGVQSSVDDCGVTTRTLRGRAVFRADFMNLNDLTADQFRPYLFVPADPPLRRVAVDATVSEDGNTVDYVVVDKEMAFGTGVNSPVMRVEALLTAGGHIDVPSLKEMVKRYAPGVLPRAVAALATGGISLLVEGAYNLPEALNTVVPEGRCSAIIKVFGDMNASRKDLATLALNYGISKFAPVWGFKRAVIVGVHVTQMAGSEDAPEVELRLEIWSSHLLVKFIFDPATIFQMMDWGVGSKDLGWNLDTPPAWIGGSNNSRGSYVREMVIQALGGPCQVPDVPPSPGPFADTAGLQ